MPLFSCEMHNGKLPEMKNNTSVHREVFAEILNEAAWQYKLHYSYTAVGDTSNHTHDATLKYCIDDNGLKGFKAYKVSKSTFFELF